MRAATRAVTRASTARRATARRAVRTTARARVADGADGDATRRFVAPTEGATATLAAALARVTRAGDVVCLAGDVGAGKSAFARAFTRAATGDGAMDVPSPTYVVQQRYARARDDGVDVDHYDLYRLRDAAEIEGMVDLGESATRAVVVVEWAERLGRSTPKTRLEVRMRALRGDETATGEVVRGAPDAADAAEDAEGEDEDVDAAYVDDAARSVRFVGFGGDWAERIARISLERE